MCTILAGTLEAAQLNPGRDNGHNGPLNGSGLAGANMLLILPSYCRNSISNTTYKGTCVQSGEVLNC